MSEAKVTRDLRQTMLLRYGPMLDVGSGHDVFDWVESGEPRTKALQKLAIITRDFAAAEAEAEELGRQLERADATAYLRFELDMHLTADDLDADEHVGAADKHSGKVQEEACR